MTQPADTDPLARAYAKQAVPEPEPDEKGNADEREEPSSPFERMARGYEEAGKP